MTGFGARDRDRGCEGVHDDIFVRALYLAHQDKEVLILGFDLLFFSRDEADRYKGAIGRRIDLAPSRILLNTSHTHTGPKVGTWLYDPPSDPHYLQELEYAIVDAACQARQAAAEVTVWAGATRSSLPLSRRRKDADGKVVWGPYAEGTVCDNLPVCLLKDSSDKPVSLLFSVSCHPSMIGGYQISAEYPGAATEQLDAHLGVTGSLFLQGTGGDAKPGIVGDAGGHWRKGTWEEVAAAGKTVADEVIHAVQVGLRQVRPEIQTASVEMEWPMEPAMGLEGLEALLADPEADTTKRLWAMDKVSCLKRGYRIPTSVTITAHGVQLGTGLRIVGLEGEAVAEHGLRILDFYREGVTFPLGYTDGAQLYLPTDDMLDEGGYEVVSYHEYRQPARLARGMNGILARALRQLRDRGIR